MKELEIVEQLFGREEAVLETLPRLYGKLCSHIAYHILKDTQDVEECLNDTWYQAWESIPPNHPASLKAYLAKLARNNALNMTKAKNAQKRQVQIMAQSLDEIDEIIGDGRDFSESSVNNLYISQILNRFLDTLPTSERIVFVRRYFYMDSISETADFCGLSEGHVKVMLHRMRKKCRKAFEQEEKKKERQGS